MPNQHSKPGYMGNKEKILEWLKEHPQSTAKQVMEAGVTSDPRHINMHLVRLYNAGLAISEKKEGQRGLVWSALEEDAVDIAPVVRVVKQQWFGCPGRDPLVAALFGPAHSQEAA